jgi:hypothetical protein
VRDLITRAHISLSRGTFRLRLDPQFIAISGFVLFEGDPSKLPMTTTKRGVDTNSELYSTVRERMQQGILHFTKCTNEWKSFEAGKLFRTNALAFGKPPRLHFFAYELLKLPWQG